MKPLELTEEQKEKLLEMCKALFPEYISYQILDLRTGTVSLWKSKAIVESIHWYEFVMNHLTKAIYTKALALQHTQDDFWELYTVESFLVRVVYYNSFSPIDYLYEQFKKFPK